MITKYEKANGVKLFALVAVLAMVLAGAAVVISDSDVEAAPNDTTYLSGSITATQNFTDGTNVVVNGDLTIPAGMSLIISGSGKLTIEENATLTIQAGGQLILQATTSYTPTITIDGDIVAQGTSSEGSYVGAIVNNTTNNGTTGVTLSGNITLQRGAELTADTVSGITNAASVSAGDIVVLNGGSIDVTKRSADVSEISKQNVKLNTGATLNINGKVIDVTVSATGTGKYYTAGAVTIDAFDSSVVSSETYKWGPDSRASSNLTFTVTSQNTPALTDSSDENSRITLRQYILNIEGTLANGDTMATAEGTIVNDTGSNVMYQASGFPYEIRPTVSVTGNLTVENESALTIIGGTTTNVSGTVTKEYDDSTSTASSPVYNGGITVNGTLIVTGEVSGYADNVTIAQSGMQNRLVVDGGMVTIYDAGMTDLIRFASAHVYGSAYIVEGQNNDTDTAYITDFDVAVTNAVAAGSEEIYNFSYGTQNYETAQEAIDRGAYVITSDITIPDGLTIYVWNALVVSEDATLTLEEGAEVLIYDDTSSTTFPARNNDGRLYVEGKVIDYYGAMEDYEGVAGVFETGGFSGDMFVYEVKKTAADESYVTYTTLKIAIAESQTGEEIQLNGNVTISEDLTIPEGVTVIADDGVTVEGATVTVNGVLDMNDADIALTNKDDGKTGAVVVNNYIANVSDNNFTTSRVNIPGAFFNGTIGDDDETMNIIASGSVAGANSQSTSTIDIYGRLSMGDVTFTQGEDYSTLTITVYGTVSGNVTLSGTDIDFIIGDESADAVFSGTVASDVTAGTSAVEFNNTNDAAVSVDYNDDGETVTTYMTLNGTISGTATVSSGTVNAGSALTVATYTNNTKSIITVASGATLNVVRGSVITTIATTGITNVDPYATLVVAGTLVYNEGTITNNGIMGVSGTMTVNSNLIIAGTVNVTGTVDVVDGDDSTTLTVTKLVLGDSEGAAGTATGAIDLYTNGVVLVYPGSNTSAAEIALNEDGTSDANETVFYINGSVYVTSYAVNGVTVGNVIPESVTLIGFNPVTIGADTSDWFSTEDMTEGTEVFSGATVQDVSVAYAEATPRTADIQVSVGQGISVYIDNVRYSNGQTAENLAVGTHTVSVQVNPGYTGTTSILFDGQAVADGTFTISPDMADKTIVLSVTGEISVDTGSTDSGDDGMGIVEILLVILVVVVVILAIIVVLRMMRS